MARDYSKYDKERLISHIYELEKQLKSQKYGLYWDTSIEQEKVVKECLDNIPILIRDEDKTIIKDGNINNMIIEGDNFHALSTLKMISGNNGLVDVIYIDPPYNTGNKDFMYNDTYVDAEDGYKHSKWLSFMKKRLLLCKDIMKRDAVIMISIDEHEHDNLCLLCDSIFGKKIGEVIRKTKTTTGDDSESFNLQHEYCVFYCKKNARVNLYGKEKTYDNYKNPDNDINGPWVSADPSAKSGGKTTYFPIENPYTGQIDYPPAGRYWAFSKDTLSEYIQSGRLVFKKEIKKNQRGFIFKRYKNKQANIYEVYDSLSYANNDYLNQIGTKEAKEFGFVDKFKYPKPTVFIKDLLFHATNKDSVVLDFFAGSATTAQATMELNSIDDGKRSFILCTNNENGICEDVAYPRIKTVITGIKKDGTKYNNNVPNNNIVFYHTDFVDDSGNSEQAKYILVEKVNELLCIKENIFNLDKEKSNNTYYHYYDNDRHLFIYTDIYQENTFTNFVKNINETCGEKIIYIYSNDNYIDEIITKDIEGTIKPIPAKIYEVYKEIVENIKGDI